MSSEEAANGKKSHWAELEISGKVRSLSSSLWTLTHLTALHLSDNSLSRIPSDIAKLHNLVYLDLSSNKIRSLPAELGNMVSLRKSAYTGYSEPLSGTRWDAQATELFA